MQPYEAGWLSIIPPIVAIALALTTKEVLSSLLIGHRFSFIYVMDDL